MDRSWLGGDISSVWTWGLKLLHSRSCCLELFMLCLFFTYYMKTSVFKGFRGRINRNCMLRTVLPLASQSMDLSLNEQNRRADKFNKTIKGR
ncbi:hypothetical protein MLD38_035271 [Melastoma candidum]|uniref:Uncharacterized protein n=1 Tax=Melastoma candidum TaxID=119954 RepID=A0ACB9MG54_9MYRT|nr:hypothetical protein MLD38_035271 [Melastoma candidum]